MVSLWYLWYGQRFMKTISKGIWTHEFGGASLDAQSARTSESRHHTYDFSRVVYRLTFSIYTPASIPLKVPQWFMGVGVIFEDFPARFQL